jgi:hypothetical protein
MTLDLLSGLEATLAQFSLTSENRANILEQDDFYVKGYFWQQL